MKKQKRIYEYTLYGKENIKYNLIYNLHALPLRSLLLLLIQFLDHLPHLGAKLRVGRPYLLLILFQLLILLF